MNDEVAKPWYREFWAWFILTPLIVVVIVSAFTVSIAVRNADDVVTDNYYKEGRMINMRLDEDLLAMNLSVVAKLVFDQELQELTLQLNHRDSFFPETLELELSHPLRAELDQTIILKRVANNQYHSELADDTLRHRWYLRLKPVYTTNDKPEWRLRGEINFASDNTIDLVPANG